MIVRASTIANHVPAGRNGSGVGDACALAGRDASAPVADGCEVTLLWGREGLETIAAEQDRLTRTLDAERLANFIDWYTCHLNVFARDCDDVLFCVVWRNGSAAAIIPFHTSSRRLLGIRTVGLELPNEPHMPTGDSIVTDGTEPEEYVPAIVEKLLSEPRLRWHYLRFVNVRRDCACAMAFARHFGASYAIQRVGGSDWCPVLPEEQFLARLAKNFARKLRQNRKRLAATAEAGFVSVSALPELDQAFEEFLDAEASSWKGAQGTRTAMRFDLPLQSFYRQLLRRFGARRRCTIHLLRVGDRTIAGQFAITSGDGVYLLKIGYNEDYARLSPGVMLLDHLFCSAASDPSIQRVSFTNDMPWMKDWQPQCQELFDVCIFRRTLAGRIARASWRLSRAVLFCRRTWAGPLWRRLFGTQQQRFKRNARNKSTEGPA